MYDLIKKELNRLEQKANLKPDSLTVAGSQRCYILDEIRSGNDKIGQIILDFLRGVDNLITAHNKEISWTGNVYAEQYVRTPHITLQDWEGDEFNFYFFVPDFKRSWLGYDERMRSLHKD